MLKPGYELLDAPGDETPSGLEIRAHGRAVIPSLDRVPRCEACAGFAGKRNNKTGVRQPVGADHGRPVATHIDRMAEQALDDVERDFRIWLRARRRCRKGEPVLPRQPRSEE